MHVTVQAQVAFISVQKQVPVQMYCDGISMIIPPLTFLAVRLTSRSLIVSLLSRSFLTGFLPFPFDVEVIVLPLLRPNPALPARPVSQTWPAETHLLWQVYSFNTTNRL